MKTALLILCLALAASDLSASGQSVPPRTPHVPVEPPWLHLANEPWAYRWLFLRFFFGL